MNERYSQRSYDQRIGNLVVKFLDYLYAHRVDGIVEGQEEGLDLNKSLNLFGSEQGLVEKDLDSMATLLGRYGYEITPEQTYTDRRVAMKKRRAQTEVRPPLEGDPSDVMEGNDHDYGEILEVGQDLIDAYHSLGLPVQSMSAFMPLGQTHDDAVRLEPSDPNWGRTMELYFRELGKVLKYLDDQGYDMDGHQAVLREFVDDLYSNAHQGTEGLTASQNRKLLTFAAKLQTKGAKKTARKILKAISIDDDKTEFMADVPHDPFSEYETLLTEEKYDEAREIYSKGSPEMKEEYDIISQRHFAAANIVKLHRFGQKLYSEKDYAGAYNIKKALENILQDLPLDDQRQIVILLVPEGAEGVDLPQAFDAQKKNKEVIDTKMTDMMDRLTPCASNEWSKEDKLEFGNYLHEIQKKLVERQKQEGAEEEESIGYSLTPKPIAPLKDAAFKALKLANKLDDQGSHAIATKLDKWMKKTADEATEMYLQERFDEDLFTPEEIKGHKPKREVGSSSCRGCGVDILYNKEDIPPKYCQHCEGEPWDVQASLRRAQKENEKKETGVAQCAGCGAEVYYDKAKGPEKFCYQCRKDTWKAEASLRRAYLKRRIEQLALAPKGVPAKVKEIADAIRRDQPDTSDEVAYRMAWETYCSYLEEGHEGCTEKGKSQRESPKPYEKAASFEGDYTKLDEYIQWQNPEEAKLVHHRAVRELELDWEEYWDEAQQAGQRAAEPDDVQAAYENFVGTKNRLKDTELEMSLRNRVLDEKKANPMDMRPDEDSTDWFQRVMSGSIKTADVSELLKSPDLRSKLKRDLEDTMKKDIGPDSLDEAYDELDDQVEEEMDEIVPPGKPDKTGRK